MPVLPETYCMVRLAGEPVVIPRAVCLHEEDAGVLWKHVEYRNGHSEVGMERATHSMHSVHSMH